MDSDKVSQFIAFVVAVITGVVMWLRGGKSKPDVPTAGDSRSDADREVARLLLERQQTHNNQVARELQAIRADFEIVAKSIKENIDSRFDQHGEELRNVTGRLHEIEKKFAVFEALQARRR